MDILNIVSNKDLLEFTEGLEYKTSFAIDKYFPKEKSKFLKATIRQIVDGGNLPVMAQFHSLDAEAKIGDRTNYTELDFKKLPIKEKLNVTERIIEAFGESVNDDMKGAILNYIFDDASNLVSRVLTRMAVANAEVLSTGKMVIKENGIDTVVDYHLPESNKVEFTQWSTTNHDILADLDTIATKVQAKGYKITKAICNSSVIGYIQKNENLINACVKVGVLPTKKNVVQLLVDNIGYDFEVIDDVYATEIGGATKNMFKNDTITFITSEDSKVGVGALGYTPEELVGINASEDSFVTLTKYVSEDPVAVWTKASSLYVPVLRNVNGLFIGTINNA